MEERINGRGQQKETLRRLLASDEPEFLALYGRRRVGKTFLIKEYFEGRCLLFELTGEKDAGLREQLQNFTFAYASTFPDANAPRSASWREALHLLASTIDRLGNDRRVVVFFDELPWLASPRSGFLQALDHLWNSWGTRRRNLLVIACGSAASWMIAKVLHNKGGLYNRLTAQMRLPPFTLAEAESYLDHRHVNLGRKDILELYMCLGGIPHYLRGVRRGESVAQAVDRLCFARDGLFRDELNQLFASLFAQSERHLAVIRVLAKRRRGVTRSELLKDLGETSGGGLSRILNELEESMFICRDSSFGQTKRDALYRLIDEYCLFHLAWMASNRGEGEGYWLARRHSRGWQTWAGLAFEAICLKHTTQIKQGLGIGGVSTHRSAWHGTVDGDGAQIDLVIDRADNCINLCEIKFSDREFTIAKSYAERLERKKHLFQRATHSKKNLFQTMITTFGCVNNRYFEELVHSELTMDSLFHP
jgi:hypothetical protein